MNHVYCFYDVDGNLLYIGKTTSLPKRIANHFSTTMIENEPWKKLVDLNNIVIYKCLTRADLDIYETYFINRLKPLYNKDKVFYDLPSFELPELKPNVYIYSSNKRTNSELGTRFEEYVTKLKELYISEKTEDQNLVKLILDKYSWLRPLISKIGYKESFKLCEQEKYHLTNVRRKAVSFQNVGLHKQIAKQLLTYSEISLNGFISAARAKEIIKEIYSSVGIEKTPKGSDLTLYFICKDYKKRVKDKIINGFIIMQNRY